jgi:hypothetical protein
MKLALMWTINDFSVNEMVSGWNMHEQLIFPYYMENNKAFVLTNSGKMSSFFYCHQRFLPRSQVQKEHKGILCW